MDISVKNLSYTYPGRKQPVLNDLNLNFESGQRVAILGPNGSGKSTLLSLIAGLYKPNHGSVSLDKQDLQGFSAPERARRISFVPQQHTPVFHFSVQEILLMGRTPYQRWFQGVDTRTEALMERVIALLQLEPFLEKSYAQLSGGELKRVLLGRALIQDTPALFLDEPDAHLDLKQQTVFMETLLSWHRAEAPLCIFSTHQPALAYRYSTHALLLPGKNLPPQFGPTPELLTPQRLAATYDLTPDFFPHFPV